MLPKKDFVKRAHRRRAALSKPTSLAAKDMGLAEERQGDVDALASNLKPYSPLELKLLKMKYTSKQIDAIRAGEEIVDTEDMVRQGRFRTDPMRIDYIDDFATLRPGVDRIPEQDGATRKPKRKAAGSETAPEAKSEASAVNDQQMLRLSQQTGLDIEAIRKLRTKMLVTHRVVNQTRMGKIQSLYFLTIAGNGDGMLGIGEGKAAEDEDGRRQAMMNAIRNMKPVPRYEGRTIFGESEAKIGATIVQLSTRPPGKWFKILIDHEVVTVAAHFHPPFETYAYELFV
jgi:small subunit ribosomal protein S5